MSIGEPPWPRSWVPPQLFWEHLENGIFEGNSWDDYITYNAIDYYGDRLILELEFKSGLHLDLETVKQEWEWMKWIAEQQDIATVSPLQVCDLHQHTKD